MKFLLPHPSGYVDRSRCVHKELIKKINQNIKLNLNYGMSSYYQVVAFFSPPLSRLATLQAKKLSVHCELISFLCRVFSGAIIWWEFEKQRSLSDVFAMM